jgi:hypothetical protein
MKLAQENISPKQLCENHIETLMNLLILEQSLNIGSKVCVYCLQIMLECTELPSQGTSNS